MGAGRCRSQDSVVGNRGELCGPLKVHRQPIASGILGDRRLHTQRFRSDAHVLRRNAIA